MLSNRFFPYSSMQEINLDWILTKVKNILRFVPDDGAVGQILRRTAHGAEWSDEQGGGGGAVSSVNGQTGAVFLDASDVGALPDTYVAPVDSVNGQTGTVVLSIPSDTSDLTNTAGFVDAAGAAAAAPVQSVNGQTGSVVLSIPSDTADLTNTAGFVDAAGAAAAAPVQSVNGQTGAVVLTAADVGAAEANTSGNGYCKMPDGTLICWGNFTATGDTMTWGNMFAINASVNIPFPVAFISAPSISYICNDDKSFGLLNSLYDEAHITRVSWMRQTAATGASVPLRYMAVGRWKA